MWLKTSLQKAIEALRVACYLDPKTGELLVRPGQGP